MANNTNKFDPKNLSANNYIAAVTAGTILIVAVSAIIIYSLVSNIVLNTKLILKKNEAKKTLTQNVENAGKLVSAYQSLGDDAELIESALPTEADFPQLVAISESMANAAGMKLVSAVPAVSTAQDESTGPAGPGKPESFRFTIDLTGNYTSLAAFVKNVEKSARPMRVEESLFKGDSGALRVELTIRSYYQGKADISTKTEVLK